MMLLMLLSLNLSWLSLHSILDTLVLTYLALGIVFFRHGGGWGISIFCFLLCCGCLWWNTSRNWNLTENCSWSIHKWRNVRSTGRSHKRFIIHEMDLGNAGGNLFGILSLSACCRILATISGRGTHSGLATPEQCKASAQLCDNAYFLLQPARWLWQYWWLVLLSLVKYKS